MHDYGKIVLKSIDWMEEAKGVGQTEALVKLTTKLTSLKV
jgi:hypothetical protein